MFSRHLWLYFPKHRQRQSITHKSTRAPFLASHCQVILGWGGKSTRSSLARGDSRGSEELPWCRAILPCPGVQSPALPHSSWWAGLRQRSAKCLLWRPGITVPCQFGLVHGQLPFRRGNAADTRSPFHSEGDNSPCPPVSRKSMDLHLLRPLPISQQPAREHPLPCSKAVWISAALAKWEERGKDGRPGCKGLHFQILALASRQRVPGVGGGLCGP